MALSMLFGRPQRKHHKASSNSYTTQRHPQRRSNGFRFPFGSNRGSFKHERRWRWWDILIALIFILGIVQFIAIVCCSLLLNKQPPPIRIPLEIYPAIQYKHIDTKTPLSTDGVTHIYHVTKEFGPATMGGMGMVVTALAAAQQRTGRMMASVVMPYYTFIRGKFPTERVVDLVINVRDKKGRLLPMEFRVWRMMHAFDVDQQSPETPPSRQQQIAVYLIGPGNRKPFNNAFRARNTVQIYYSPPGLPQEWREEYFIKAAAEFLAHQSSATDEEQLFAPVGSRKRVDVIHLHGATNAYVAKYIRDHERYGQLGPQPPAVVYTMHDYLDELQYTNTINNVKMFLDGPEDGLDQYMRGNRVFMSSLGIDYSDVTTFVSRSMAADIVEGRLDFYLKELVMKSILRKAERKQFFGITNGVDFGQLDPFDNAQLALRKLNFPKTAYGLVRDAVSRNKSKQMDGKCIWRLNPSVKTYATHAKGRAKQYLVRRGMLSENDVERPVVLFIGRFQYNKGLEIFDEAAQYFVKHNVKFIVMGQPNNYPLDWVLALQERYPDHVRVFSTAKDQRKWSVYYRAAADFVFVPSLTESFGLVAAEGLLFGSPVISTGVGGLKEFLIDRPTKETRLVQVKKTKHAKTITVVSQERYNAYLFNASTLEKAIEDAVADYQSNKANNGRREEFTLRMVASAFALSWDRGQEEGPVYDYLRVYQAALAQRHLPTLTLHEVQKGKQTSTTDSNS